MIDNSQKLPSSFGWLNVTQFLGALNDNMFKFFIVFFLISVGPEGSETTVNATAGVVFVLPFLLFIATAGVVADRTSKRNVLVSVKGFEILVMLAGVAAFTIGESWALYCVLFLMALQSTFFGPSKYGIVPELVGRERLSRANGFLQAFTYLAIIVGTVLAPALGKALDGNYAVAAYFCVGAAVIGFVASTRIERTPVAGPDAKFSWLFLRDIWRTLMSIRGDGFLVLAVIASSYFLLIAAFMQLNIIPYGRQVLGFSPEDSTLVFLLAALGIGLGSVTAGKVSGRNVEFGLVPVGALFLTISTIGLWLAPPNVAVVGVLVGLSGIGAGIFIVPIQAFIQFRSPHDRLGEILAASSFLSWVGVLIASLLLFWFDSGLHLTAAQGYLIIGVMTAVLTCVSFWVLPDFFLRFLVMVLTHTLYRIRIFGKENVPVEGPALLIANHSAWVDAALLVATQQRRLKFLMSREIYNGMGWARPFLDLAGVIPVSGRDGRSQIEASLSEAREQLDAGYMVCIFAEGALTRSGMMRQFKSGFSRILKGTDHPIIPVYIGGAWGSISSYYYGKLWSRMPKKIPFPVSIIFGKPMAADSTPSEVRLQVQELSTEYYNHRKDLACPLGDRFVSTARSNWSRQAISDTTGRSLTFGRTLAGTIALADVLKRITAGQERVGILMPASVPGALCNTALAILGKVSVNLNFTSSPDALAAAIESAELKTVLTSRKFLEKLEALEAPPGAVFLEDLQKEISGAAKLWALFRARFWPRRWLVQWRGFHADKVATILFSSGSTGRPKGVMLSHHNILSNVEAGCHLMKIQANDNISGLLPFFHAFGFTATVWVPLVWGCRVSYHPNPLEAGRIAEMVRERGCTVMVATPTFLLSYIRRAAPDDFRTIRYCVVGAEKLKPRIADAFEERFGVRPLEGYGATELSPMAAFNVPDVELDGVVQIGTKEGTIGQPLPGVTMKVVDPETREPLENGEEGLLLVKGPNVMVGYLNDEQATTEVLRDGWYDSRDIARIDDDGFVTLTDRLSRFSKIGGEMVPHIAVEEVLLAGLDTAERVVSVTSVPDERKGERIVVVHTAEAGDVRELQRIIKESELPNLWKPGRGSYVLVDEIPLLGSGKLDINGLKALALQGEADSGSSSSS